MSQGTYQKQVPCVYFRKEVCLQFCKTHGLEILRSRFPDDFMAASLKDSKWLDGHNRVGTGDSGTWMFRSQFCVVNFLIPFNFFMSLRWK